jgi:hypothetical protein
MRITISDGAGTILDREVPDDPRLTEFDKHQSNILGVLQKVYVKGLPSKPFDATKAWGRLSVHARSFLDRRGGKQPTRSASERRERLRDIAKRLRPARSLVDRAMKTEAREDLFSAWWEVAGGEHADPNGIFNAAYMDVKFNEMVKGLSDLEAAASYAASRITSRKRGKSPILSRDDLWNLAALYRDVTGSKPGAGRGPFADFVSEFLTALGHADDIDFDSMIEAIKGARRWAVTDPVARKWGPSPFGEEA